MFTLSLQTTEDGSQFSTFLMKITPDNPILQIWRKKIDDNWALFCKTLLSFDIENKVVEKSL